LDTMLAEEAADDSRGISAAIKQPPSISIFALFIVLPSFPAVARPLPR